MKNIIFLVSLLSVPAALASFYQSNCSSPDGKISISNGHVSNQVLVGVYDTNSNETVLVDMAGDIEQEVLSEQNLFAKSETHCSEGATSGYWTSESVDYQRIRLTKKDGSLFAKETIGVSEDLKSVEAHILCQMDMNSRALCE